MTTNDTVEPSTAAEPATPSTKKAGARPAKAAGKRPAGKASASKTSSTKPTKRPAKRPPRPPVKRRIPPNVDEIAAAAITGSARKRRRLAKQRIRRKAPARWVVRLFADTNTDGPRARVGFVWFLLLLPAVYVGATTTAVLFGLIAGVAALQTGQAWRRAGYRPSRLVAFPFAVAMPAAAATTYASPGLVLAALPIVALLVALVVPRRRRRTSALAAAGLTVRCVIAPGLAATGVVYTARLGVGAAIVFVLLVSAYDVGSFLVGAEASSPSHGIIAGSLCTLAVIAPVWAFQLPPFDGESAAWIFAGMVAVFAPLGQIAASLCLPTANTWVPALRRLDAYVITAPLWAWSLWSYLG